MSVTADGRLSARLMAALRIHKLSPSQRLILAELVAAADDDGQVRIEVNDLILRVDVAEITILAGVARIEALGYLTDLSWRLQMTTNARYREGRRAFTAIVSGVGEG